MIRLRSLSNELRARASFGETGFSGVHRKLRVAVMTALAIFIGGTSSVFACPVCFAAEETSMINGTRVGILVLLAITLVVQGAFVGFFLYLRNRAKHIADIELDTEWSELQRASRTS